MGIDISSSSDHCKYYYPLKTRCSASEITDLLRKRNYHYFYMKWISSWPEGPGVRTPPQPRSEEPVRSTQNPKENLTVTSYSGATQSLSCMPETTTPPPPMASGINIYSFFSDIRNNYSRYLEKTILDIPKQVRILYIQNSYFGYQKQQFRISENKHLFRISKIVIMDIRNNYFGYPK